MEGGGSKCNVAEKRRRTGNAFDRRIFVATMAAMERKSEEGEKRRRFFFVPPPRQMPKGRVCLSFRGFHPFRRMAR